MRILHVSDAYLPKQGGIEIQVSDLARRQAETGHDVTVLTCAPDLTGRRRRTGVGVPDPEPPVPGGPVPELRVGIPWWTPRGANEQVYAILRRDRPDVVHAHLSVLSPLSILVVRAAARERVPVVMTLHSLWWLATPLYAIAHVLLAGGAGPSPGRRSASWPRHPCVASSAVAGRSPCCRTASNRRTGGSTRSRGTRARSSSSA